MGCDTVLLGDWFPVFQGFMVPSPSRVRHHDLGNGGNHLSIDTALCENKSGLLCAQVSGF